MKALFNLAKPMLHALDAEDAHRLTIKALKMAPPLGAPRADKMLAQKLFGLDFMHPLGLAAGFDKGCEVANAMQSIGFSHVECGTVTPRPQDGNPRPRVFRDADTKAVINRMGFPNPGADVFFANMRAAKHKGKSQIIGANIGKNKETENALLDYALLAGRANGVADYVTINISSPNTPGLRDLQNGDFVRHCVAAVRENYEGPVLIKLAPDLKDEQLQDMAQACFVADGVILTNTTLDRPEYLPVSFSGQGGGLSGAPLTQKSLDVLRQFQKTTRGKVSIISAGGISSVDDVVTRIKAGASLVQIYTALVFEGPGLVQEIVRQLPQKLRAEGFSNIREAIGADLR